MDLAPHPTNSAQREFTRQIDEIIKGPHGLSGPEMVAILAQRIALLIAIEKVVDRDTMMSLMALNVGTVLAKLDAMQ